MNKAERLAMLHNPSAVMSATQMQILERMYEATKTSKGEKGDTPQKYVDYFTPEEIDQVVAHIRSQVRHGKDGKDGAPGADGADGRHGRDGADGADGEDGAPGADGKSPLPSEVVPHVVAALKGMKISPDQVEGLPDIKDLNGLIAFLKRGGFRGGGGTVTTGGGSTPTAPTSGNVDGVNAAFGAPSDPKYAVADGTTYFEGAGYSYAGGVVTFTVAPSEYVRLFL